jgi:hypothetical protein
MQPSLLAFLALAAGSPPAAPSAQPTPVDAGVAPQPAPAADATQPKHRNNPVPGVAWYAQPSLNERYGGYYVGGGCGGGYFTYKHGELRHPDEGTWGMDYVGHWLPHRVVLKWWHGRREQGGVGSYYPEYPCHVPNPLSNPPPNEKSPAHIPGEPEH